MENRVALIGSGNAFFKDEGMGLYAAKYIKENYIFTPEIEIVDGGTLGFRKVGDISIKTTDEFLDGTLIKKTANEVEIAEMLQICSLTEAMAETTVISIVPNDIIAVEVALSSELKESWNTYINTVLSKIESLGIKMTKKDKECSLDEILDIFANPSIEHSRGF